jgi:hypothetical protein
MSTSYTPAIGLSKPASGDRTWDVPILASLDTLDALAPLGGLSVGLAENPSASLNVKVSAGSYRKADGTVGTYAGTSSQATTTATTNYVFLTDAGVLTVNTTGFPATSHVRLATVVAGATTITSITDARISLASLGVTVYLALSGGTFADAGGVVTVGTGTTNGTKIGGSAADKIGYWGAGPVVQPSGASQAALGASTAATLTDSTTGTAGATIGDVGASFSQATLNSIHASLTSQINKLNADLAATRTLLTAIRSGLVTPGSIKGSA